MSMKANMKSMCYTEQSGEESVDKLLMMFGMQKKLRIYFEHLAGCDDNAILIVARAGRRL